MEAEIRKRKNDVAFPKLGGQGNALTASLGFFRASTY